VNCFGGMLDMNLFAAIIERLVTRKILTKPMVVRLRGQNESEAHERLRALKKIYPEIYVINDFLEAVE
jgi:succinyl-CoA synthetase beta subunit